MSQLSEYPLAIDALLQQPPASLLPWYAIRVRSNFERTASAAMRSRGYEEYLPTYLKRSSWSDRVKTIDVPIFPGYLFCRLDISRRLPVLQSPGVIDIIRFGQDFLPVPEHEIAALQQLLTSGSTVFPWPYLTIGQRVRIEHGSMDGLEGILVRVRNQFRLVVSVQLLMRSVSVEVERDWIRPLN